MPQYKCPRCGSRLNDDPGLCYNCRCDDYYNGKCDSWGNPLFKEISIEYYEYLREIEKKYKLLNR